MMADFLNGAIFAVPLAGAVWVVLHSIPRRRLNAATRHVIWWLALAAALALPLVSVRPIARAAKGAPAAASIGIQVIQIDGGPSAKAPVPFHLPVRIPASWTVWLAALWITWSALLLIRLLVSLRALRRAREQAREIPLEWRSHAARWQSRVLAADVAAPLASAAILIPARLFDELEAHEMDAIVAHEAAHLARRDDWTILVERLLIAIFPWNMAACFIARQIDLEREIACDDCVVETTGSAAGYAECLTRVVELCGGIRPSYAAAAMAGHRAHLSRRVAFLLETARSPHPRLRTPLVVPFAAGLLLLALAASHVPRVAAFVGPPSPAMAAVTTVSDTPSAPPAPLPPSPRPAPQTASQPTNSKRLLVLFLDLQSFSADDFDRAIAAFGRFIDRQFRDGDALAIMTSGADVKVANDFTADRNSLRKTLAEIASAGPPSSNTPYDSARTLSGLETAVRMLGAISDKKILVYFAGGRALPPADPSLQALINEAIRVHVALYPIDARGIVK